MNNALTVTISREEIRPQLWVTVYHASDPIDGMPVEIMVLPDGARVYSVDEYASTVPWRNTHEEILTLCGLTR